MSDHTELRDAIAVAIAHAVDGHARDAGAFNGAARDVIAGPLAPILAEAARLTAELADPERRRLQAIGAQWDDMRKRIADKVPHLYEAASLSLTHLERNRLKAKATGVTLALSFIDEHARLAAGAADAGEAQPWLNESVDDERRMFPAEDRLPGTLGAADTGEAT